jgi:hypothetical protein
MDDFKIWIYIIIGAIYVLSRLRKRPDQSPPETGHTTPPVRDTNEWRPSSPQKQLTFEELLREITEGKQAEEKRTYQPKPAEEGLCISQSRLMSNQETCSRRPMWIMMTI